MMVPLAKDSFKVNFINRFLEELVKIFIHLVNDWGGPGSTKISEVSPSLAVVTRLSAGRKARISAVWLFSTKCCAMCLSDKPKQSMYSYLLKEGQLGDDRALWLRSGVSKSDWRKKESNSKKASKRRKHKSFGILPTTCKSPHVHRPITQKDLS